MTCGLSSQSPVDNCHLIQQQVFAWVHQASISNIGSNFKSKGFLLVFTLCHALIHFLKIKNSTNLKSLSTYWRLAYTKWSLLKWINRLLYGTTFKSSPWSLQAMHCDTITVSSRFFLLVNVLEMSSQGFWSNHHWISDLLELTSEFLMHPSLIIATPCKEMTHCWLMWSILVWYNSGWWIHQLNTCQ